MDRKSIVHKSMVKAVLTGTAASFIFLTVVLMVFTPLAFLTLGLSSGFMTALFAGAVFFLLVTLLSGIGTAISGGLFFVIPALLLVRLATQTYENEDGEKEFFPADRLFYWILGMAAIATAGAFFLEAGHPGGLPGMLSDNFGVNQELREFMATLTNTPMTDEQIAMLGVSFVIIVPTFWVGIMTGCLLLAQYFNTLLGTHLRPSPEYSRFTLPSSFELMIAVCIVLSFVIDGWPNTLIVAFVGILLFAFFLLGLAAIHVISYRVQQRSFLLAIIYILTFLFSFVYFLVSIIGILESRFGLRQRYGIKKGS